MVGFKRVVLLMVVIIIIDFEGVKGGNFAFFLWVARYCFMVVVMAVFVW